MDMLAIFADGLGLMIGSLLLAGGLTFFAWWLGEALNRPWVGGVVILLVIAGLLGSPLEQSLFARMLAIFGIVGGILLWFVRRDGTTVQEQPPRS
jgi:hypothetical protein